MQCLKVCFWRSTSDGLAQCYYSCKQDNTRPTLKVWSTTSLGANQRRWNETSERVGSVAKGPYTPEDRKYSHADFIQKKLKENFIKWEKPIRLENSILVSADKRRFCKIFCISKNQGSLEPIVSLHLTFFKISLEFSICFRVSYQFVSRYFLIDFGMKLPDWQLSKLWPKSQAPLYE